MDPSVTPQSVPDTMAEAYRTPGPGRVCLVLGAGNASSIGPLDIIHKLFVENQVVICKSHPLWWPTSRRSTTRRWRPWCRY